MFICIWLKKSKKHDTWRPRCRLRYHHGSRFKLSCRHQVVVVLVGVGVGGAFTLTVTQWQLKQISKSEWNPTSAEEWVGDWIQSVLSAWSWSQVVTGCGLALLMVFFSREAGGGGPNQLNLEGYSHPTISGNQKGGCTQAWVCHETAMTSSKSQYFIFCVLIK